MRRPSPLLAFLTTAAVTTALTVSPMATSHADAATKVVHFKNCTALNKVYPHGVGKPGAKDHSSSKPVTNFKVDKALYQANDGPRNTKTGEYDLDRDNDGVACEKR